MITPWLLILVLGGTAAPASPATPADPTATAPSPQVLTLDELVRAAAEHYPRRREQRLRGAIAGQRLDNLDTRRRPALEVLGQAAYHSEVASLPAGIGASPPQEQYSVALDANQLLWDGGRTEQEKVLEAMAREVDVLAVEVDFFAWRQRLEEAYFRALSSRAELDLLHTLVEDLEAQRAVLERRVAAGVALDGDRAVLAAELEGQRQRMVESTAERRAALDWLAALSGRDIADGVELAVPEPEPPSDLRATALAAAWGEGVGRPELDQLRGTQHLLEEQKLLATLAKKPTVSAFAQGGIGRPADQNFFERDPTPYVVLGLRLRWRPLDWGVAERQQEISRLEQEVSEARLETFLDTLSADLQQLARRIEATHSVLDSDQRIVELRQVSSHQAAAQLRAGVITPSAYLIERNAEHRARLTREQHRLRLARDIVDFVTTLGASS